MQKKINGAKIWIRMRLESGAESPALIGQGSVIARPKLQRVGGVVVDALIANVSSHALEIVERDRFSEVPSLPWDTKLVGRARSGQS
jgi:hypothetical protein